MKKGLGIAILLVVLTPMAAVAKDGWYNGIYMGLGAGAGRIEADLNKLGLMPANAAGVPEPIESSNYSKTSITGKIFAGYRIFRFLAIEGGYTKMDEASRQYCFLDSTGECTESRGDPVTPSTTSVISSSAWTVELPTDGWTLYGVGLFPFNDSFEVFAKVGAIAWETEASGYEKIVGGYVPVKDPLVPATNVAVSKKFDGTDLAAGLGVNFNHPSGFAVRTELEYYDISEFDKTYVFTMSAMYMF